MYQLRSILVFCLALCASLLAAGVNPGSVELSASTDGEVSFVLVSDIGDPTVSFAPTSGVVSQTPLGGGQHEISYTPNAGFSGQDVFSIESIVLEGGFFPKTERTLVHVSIVPSVVDATDDFIIIPGDDPITIYPLENDESELGSHSLSSIVDVSAGNAVIDVDNSILYTPSDLDALQFIVYSIQDSIGSTDVATVYLIPENDDVQSFTEDFSISSSQSQYLILPDGSFSLQTGPSSGTVSAINDRVYSYLPGADDVEETIVFANADGFTGTFTVNVYSAVQDDGVVQDDVVFTSVGSTVIFDVFANDFDNDLSLDIVSLSSDLEFLGGGQLSFTPEAGFAGLKEYTYTASNEFTSEVGQIKIAVTNFNPQSVETYEFTTLAGGVLTLGYDVPLVDYYFEVASDPQFGSLAYHDGQSVVSTSCGDVVGKNVIYTPVTGFTGVDEFDMLYCPDDGVNPCELIKTTVQVNANPDGECNCLEDCVWRGDANHDGRVDMLDVLTIGRNLGQAGSTREDADQWQGQSVPNWLLFNQYGVNAKHSDTDGNGVITVDDIDVVISNYEQVHTYSQSNVLNVKDYPFSLVPRSTNVEVGDRMYIDVILGSPEYPVVDMSGIAFKILLDPAVVDSASASFEFDPSGYFRKQSPFVDVVLQPQDGHFIVSGSKTNLLTSNGHGIIATLDFIVEEDIEGVKTPEKWRSAKSTYTFNMAAVDIILEDGNGYQFSVADVREEVEIELEKDENPTLLTSNDLQVYPNPVSESLVVEAIVGDIITMHDVLGNRVYSQTVSTDAIHTVNVSEFAVGTYTLTRKGPASSQTVKLLVVR